MNNRIYLDNAATTKVDDDIINQITKYFDIDYANPSSIHKDGRIAKNIIDISRSYIAQLINSSDNEIYFTSGGTESDNLAIQGIANKDKKHIITSKIEHHAILNTCKYMQTLGYSITYLDVDKYGFVNPMELEKNIRKDTCLVSIMFANNEIGTIEPIKELSAIAHKHNALFHTDAVQALGKFDIDVKDLDVDMMSISSHKIHGLKGIGALYLKKHTAINPIIFGGNQENKKRAGTQNVPAIASFGLACKKLLNNHEQRQKIKNLRDYFIQEVKIKIKDSILTGSEGNLRLINNISFCFKNIDSNMLLVLLDKANISASSGSACTSGAIENSHVLEAIKIDDEYINGNIRFTLSKYNSKEEIDYTISKLSELINKLRQ